VKEIDTIGDERSYRFYFFFLNFFQTVFRIYIVSIIFINYLTMQKIGEKMLLR